MASSFLGLQMVVTLRSPPERLCGSISGVDAGRSLTLRNVWSLDTRQWLQQVLLHPDNIVDIVDAGKVHAAAEFVSRPAPRSPAPAVAVAAAVATFSKDSREVADASRVASSTFADPAILSIRSRPEQRSKIEPKTALTHHTVPNPPPVRGAVLSPGTGAPSSAISSAISHSDAPLDPPLDASDSIKVTGGQVPGSQPAPDPALAAVSGRPTQPQDAASKRRRQRSGRSAKQNASGEHADGPDLHRTPGRGKGWRQTPILQSTSTFQPFNSLKRGVRGGENGWASEDITDVQEMGAFDFEGGLAKFDKRTLFDQLRKEDQIDSADRLVSHNRLPRGDPRAADNRKLHPSENVLDLPASAARKGQREAHATGQDFWKSDADDGLLGDGERLRGRGHESRQSSRRGDSKRSATEKSQSRKIASAVGSAQGLLRVSSGLSTHSQHVLSRSRLASSRLDERHSQQPLQGFYLVPSRRRLETVSPLQMLNLENIAHNELGLTEEMMTENAGRGVAAVALAALTDPAVQLRTQAQTASSSIAPIASTMVVLAGNNKSGARAVAAARHLRNRQITVCVCIVGIERGERELLEDMRRQVRLFRNFGGSVYSKAELFEHLRNASLPMLTIDTPRTAIAAKPPVVTLIVDGLLGLTISFDELRTGDQATVYELIEWANRKEAFALAIDIPAGIDASSGTATIVDGNPLFIQPRYVVAVGAPKHGLLSAMLAAEESGDASTTVPADDSILDWKLFLVDIGLGPAVWKRAGAKIRRGIDFDDKWVLEVMYQGADDVDEEDDLG